MTVKDIVNVMPKNRYLFIDIYKDYKCYWWSGVVDDLGAFDLGDVGNIFKKEVSLIDDYFDGGIHAIKLIVKEK